MERYYDLIPDTQPTCVKVGADPVFVGPDCLESPVTVRVLPPDAPAHLLHDGDALVVRWHGLPLLLPIEEDPRGAHVAWMEGDGDQPEGWLCGNAGILPSFEACLEARKGWRIPRDGLTVSARHLTVRQLVDFCTLVSMRCRLLRPVSPPDPRR
ncbi:MAG: hypothetical protein KC656_03405 [Myxococcales bacterium]|nr:hypothetical protein [Myxococcales bacterium]MCB9671562.1 hypothetical protein [Alphaproteobacteria bacterium]MCB9691848.1 hypothetical protein [Alphaproteobacteria bacterium]